MRRVHKTSLLIGFLIAVTLLFVIEKTVFTVRNRIAVVEMNTLVYDFAGMKAATERYNQRLREWSLLSDSLERAVVRLEQAFKESRGRSAIVDTNLHSIRIARQRYVDHMKYVEEQAQIEDRKLTLGVLNQLNDYIKRYAEEGRYDVVLCKSESEPFGHFSEALNITSQVLAFANSNYTSGH